MRKPQVEMRTNTFVVVHDITIGGCVTLSLWTATNDFALFVPTCSYDFEYMCTKFQKIARTNVQAQSHWSRRGAHKVFRYL